MFEEPGDDRVLRHFTVSPRRMVLYTADGQSLSLEDWYRGKHAFLVCGGPSLATMPLNEMARPGIVSMGVNNSWGIWRPTLWCCADDPGQFLDVCWKDPSIIKFTPIAHLNTPLAVRRADGTFRRSMYKASEMPGVLYFRRNNRFDPATFFTEGTVNWGAGEKITDAIGIRASRSVMLIALRLLFYLGFRHIYIVGADFHMAPGREYAWEQHKPVKAHRSNNATYEILNKRFSALLPHLATAKCEVYNCTPGGNLNAFPRMPFAEAVERATKEASTPVGLAGWYTQRERKR